MTILILGLAAWFILHLFPIFAPALRANLKQSLGGAYMGVFALATVAAVAIMVIGYQQAPYVEIWSPPAFLTHINNLLMVLAVLLFIAGSFKSSVVRKVVRHPQLNGTKTWAIGHLLVNGDLASIILFAGLFIWALIAMIGTNKRDGKPPIEASPTTMGLVIHIVVALAVTAVVIAGHWYLGGVWPLPA